MIFCFFFRIEICALPYRVTYYGELRIQGALRVFLYASTVDRIKELWSKLKADVKCKFLTKKDSLTLRITGSTKYVTASDC
ncbi:hypothetical protein INT45_007096 [Circinella minor]|uniref:Uncharacterized protein n=1 Tax=Circinella minor TaxID=1195481 RepID=A0A8H7SCS2_9FUNG|nr:hypothetical protein INT45_007096 [Circinella minor]